MPNLAKMSKITLNLVLQWLYEHVDLPFEDFKNKKWNIYANLK